MRQCHFAEALPNICLDLHAYLVHETVFPFLHDLYKAESTLDHARTLHITTAHTHDTTAVW